MHIVGIIAEYNPFHNGHAYQIQKTKLETNCDYVIVAMSGNFSQRGTATIADKYTRAKMALSSGADLVLELPMPYATASAERFAQGAISLFNQTGCINTLSFGSELGELALLEDIAHLLLHPTDTFNHQLRLYLQEGISYPRARTKAIINTLDTKAMHAYTPLELEGLISSPNNILGIEYLKAIKHYQTSITPFTVKRLQAGYHDTNVYDTIASATALRHNYHQGNLSTLKQCIPTSAYDNWDLSTHQAPNMDRLLPFLQYKLMISPKRDLYSHWDIPKDLINSILSTDFATTSFDDVVKNLTSKTYTSATVQRSLLRLVFDIRQERMHQLNVIDWIPYIRVLGCRQSSLPLIGHLSKKAHCPIITNVNKGYAHLSPLAQQLLDYDLLATKVYHYLTNQPYLYTQDYTQNFLKVD